jgi:hypothetical protein
MSDITNQASWLLDEINKADDRSASFSCENSNVIYSGNEITNGDPKILGSCKGIENEESFENPLETIDYEFKMLLYCVEKLSDNNYFIRNDLSLS